MAEQDGKGFCFVSVFLIQFMLGQMAARFQQIQQIRLRFRIEVLDQGF